ncbi:MAG TPA: methyltransferase domain-containing protein [Casimicrobiaceae bacterium]|jgi:SAM-dependent methyltransferase
MPAHKFFQRGDAPLVDSPNGRMWWHSMPLPDGTRISGYHADKAVQLKMWDALELDDLTGKRVLDIGAADGFFSLAASFVGAASVTSIGTTHWATWPHNITLAAQRWSAKLAIETGDFRTHALPGPFDVILFLGVLYHVEDVFGCMRRLRELLAPGGLIVMETQMTSIASDLPIFECASDTYPTTVHQGRQSLDGVGISNFLLPNDAAVRNLADSFGFGCEPMDSARNVYSRELTGRRIYRLARR